MADLNELKIPAAMRAVSEAIITLTDAVCADMLDEEYATGDDLSAGVRCRQIHAGREGQTGP